MHTRASGRKTEPCALQLPATPVDDSELRDDERRVGRDGRRENASAGQLDPRKGADRNRSDNHPPNQPQIEKRMLCAGARKHERAFILSSRADVSHDRSFMRSGSKDGSV